VLALHPDLHPEQGDRERELWHRVHAAWEHGDLEALEILATLLDDDEVEPDATLDRAETLRDEVDKLDGQLQRLSRKLTELRAEPPFDLERQLGDEAWIEERRRASEARCEELRAHAAFLEREVELLRREEPYDARHLAH
jgi:hypothetical protein